MHSIIGFNADITEQGISLNGGFSEESKKYFELLIMNEFKKDRRFLHANIKDASVHELHISKRAAEDKAILVGSVCIGNGNYIKYIINSIQLNINVELQREE